MFVEHTSGIAQLLFVFLGQLIPINMDMPCMLSQVNPSLDFVKQLLWYKLASHAPGQIAYGKDDYRSYAGPKGWTISRKSMDSK